MADRLYALRRYSYQINFANALTQMKNRIVAWLIGPDSRGVVSPLVTQIVRAVEPVRPGRSAPRKPNATTSRRFHGNNKRAR